MSSFKIGYVKNILILPKQKEDATALGKLEYDHFAIENTQTYNPVYNLYFKMNDGNYNTICLNHKYHFVDMETVYDYSEQNIHSRNVHLKFAPLLDPLRYLTGKYNAFPEKDLRALPNLTNLPDNGFTKLYDYNNASYVDNFFCYLSSQLLHHHGFFNGIDYYGSFLTIQHKYRMNVADDLEFLMQHDYFRKQKGVLYEIEDLDDPFSNFGSRGNKQKLVIDHLDENVLLDDIVDLGGGGDASGDDDDDEKFKKNELVPLEMNVESNDESIDLVKSNVDSDSDCGSDVSYSDNEQDSDIDSDNKHSETDEGKKKQHNTQHDNTDEQNEADDDDNDDSTSSCESYDHDNDSPHLAYLYNFPVQMICLEKCQGTLDELFLSNEMDEMSGNAMLMQIIMTLITYQKAFHFTHNDLHTNNVMWNLTKEKHLFYKFNDVVYRVPTYGRIYKLIDFGRAIYKFKGEILCSDSFSPEGDASTQYNFGPYYNPNKNIVEPNYSFDLCRLATSIYDFILDEQDDIKETQLKGDTFQNIIHKLVMDDSGRNILYKRNGEDRYPGFKLYKLIARTVHGACPSEQLTKKPFKYYVWNKKVPTHALFFDMDVLPDYTTA